MNTRKRLIALLICIQMVLSVMSPYGSILVGSEESTSEPSTNNSSLGATAEPIQSSTVIKSIFPECELTWKSFRDYLLDQARVAWNYPSTYIGYEISFLECWDSVECKSGFTGDEESVYIDLNFTDAHISDAIDAYEAKLVIEDCYKEESTEKLYYKVKAADGYTLPDILEENPYILHIEWAEISSGNIDSYPPSFFIGQLKGIFNTQTGSIVLKKYPVAATHEYTADISTLPQIFDVTPSFSIGSDGEIIWDHYNVGDIASQYTEYQYVESAYITVIPAEATRAYEQLINAEDVYEYDQLLSKTPSNVMAQFSDAHKSNLDDCIEALNELEKTEYSTVIQFNGVDVPVSVKGNLPDDVTLEVSAVTNDSLIDEGFDIKHTSDIIIALDIKLINDDDGTEWQPKEGRKIAVSIGVGALGYEDGTVLALQHKHGETIENYDVVVVTDGAVTVYTYGFSIYRVNETDSTTAITGTTVTSGGTFELTVGKSAIYYINSLTGLPNNNRIGTWNVRDDSGAIYYVVHSQSAIGNSGMYVPWIEIVALKIASNVTLTFNYRNNQNQTVSETYTLNIVAPKADAGKTDLYIKDDVNMSGKIVATVVDENGNEVTDGLEGASFSWTRSDNHFITPRAYEDNYRSVNIAVDHAGMVEARRESGPITYTVDVIFSDSTTDSAEYTVYYQSEIINANFESPTATQDYTFFPNGWDQLFWKTTAPGTGSNISKDIEYGFPQNGGTGWGVTQAASGKQFAEINAEEFGTLYQDIITAPGEDIDWEFAHAPRQNQNWGSNVSGGGWNDNETYFSNAMFIVIGATEKAQALIHQDLVTLGQTAKTQAGDNNNFLTGKEPVEVTYNGAIYYVWYHDAGTVRNNDNSPYQGENNGWTQLSGSYTVPNGQYRTRLFFLSEQKYDGGQNAGNLIDKTMAGQYKDYLVEYYLGIVDINNQLIYEKLEADEDGTALIYSSTELEKLDDLISKGQYLHKVLINGENYPYNIRYNGDASLYIENYPYSADFPKDEYPEYDIVMQIYLRDVVMSVQKEIEFPTALTPEQRLTIIEELNKNGSYQAEFTTVSVDSGEYNFSDIGYATITQRDPSGKYTGYYSVENYPEKNHTYRVTETSSTEIVGLELVGTTYTTYLYTNGKRSETPIESNDYAQFEIKRIPGDMNTPAQDINFAEIFVKNIYKEKKTTIYYEAVGNGKLKFVGGTEFIDRPTEQIDFYSEEAKGAAVFPGAGATFVGWFTDPECENEVTAKDGYLDPVTKSFKPNANIINAPSVTFYAKFETGSITINRENANPGQTFVYHIVGGGVDMYVTVECDENGKGSKEIFEVALNNSYTVTELEDWSWRHTGNSATQSNSDTKHLLFDFTNNKKDEEWLNGYSPEEKNVFN